jgi:hypothetical protein
MVEEKLVESFKKDNNCLRLGMSGLVRFEDLMEGKRSFRAERELEEKRRPLLELEEQKRCPTNIC